MKSSIVSRRIHDRITSMIKECGHVHPEFVCDFNKEHKQKEIAVQLLNRLTRRGVLTRVHEETYIVKPLCKK